MKRYDITTKAMLRKAGVPFREYTKSRMNPRVVVDGVEVMQSCGLVIIYTNGVVCSSVIEEAMKDVDFRFVINGERIEGEEVVESTVEPTNEGNENMELNVIPFGGIFEYMKALGEEREYTLNYEGRGVAFHVGEHVTITCPVGFDLKKIKELRDYTFEIVNQTRANNQSTIVVLLTGFKAYDVDMTVSETLYKQHQHIITQKMCYNNTFNVISNNDLVYDAIQAGVISICYGFMTVGNNLNVVVRHAFLIDEFEDVVDVTQMCLSKPRQNVKYYIAKRFNSVDEYLNAIESNNNEPALNGTLAHEFVALASYLEDCGFLCLT